MTKSKLSLKTILGSKSDLSENCEMIETLKRFEPQSKMHFDYDSNSDQRERTVQAWLHDEGIEIDTQSPIQTVGDVRKILTDILQDIILKDTSLS